MADEYDRRARVYPALLAVLPLSLMGLIFGLTDAEWWKGVAGVATASGFWVFAAQIGRHPGKKLEPSLWQTWGGAPTTSMLRHREAQNPVRLKRLHERVMTATGLPLPTAEEEKANPHAGDAVYEAAVAELIEQTRGDPLLLKENINYGFRRNMLGLRPWAIAVCALAVGVTALVAFAGQPSFLAVEHSLGVTLMGIDVLTAAAWWKLVTPDWVRQPALAYAARLFEAARSVS